MEYNPLTDSLEFTFNTCIRESETPIQFKTWNGFEFECSKFMRVYDASRPDRQVSYVCLEGSGKGRIVMLSARQLSAMRHNERMN
jgi:hypothetical protein